MRRLFRLLLPGRQAAGWSAVAAILAVLAAVAAIVLLALSGWLITASALAGTGALLVLDIFAPGAGIRAAAVGRTAARYLERLVGHEATFRQLAELRVAVFDRLLKLPVANLESLRRGDTLNRLTSDIDVLDHFIPRLMLPTAAAVLATLFTAAWLVVLDARLSMAVMGFLIGLGGLVVVGGIALSRGPGRRLALATPRMRSSLEEWLFGLAELISTGRARDRADGVLSAVDRQLEAQLALRRIEAVMQTGLAAAGYAGFWAVLVLVLGMYADESLTAPVAAAVALVALGLVDAWQPLAASWSFLETCRQSAERVEELPGERRGESAPPESSAPGSDLVLDDATFGYPGQAAPVFSDLSLHVDSGEHVLIQGPSGIGKSTLGRILAGILSPERGSLRSGGVDIADCPEAVVRARIGYLTQQPVLFEDTIRANLALGDPRADEERIGDALETVGLGRLVESLPAGLETWIGQHGQTFSGGEGRRLALARMLVADFPVMILDEPMAGVDAATAAAVADRLVPILKGRTVVVLSHDPGVLPRFDRRFGFDGRRLQERD
ncbi:MAG: thiol reductant ABC exporter subunit CydC [Candidatus Wenzhouxiangella sp. M2_3B_020]